MIWVTSAEVNEFESDIAFLLVDERKSVLVEPLNSIFPQGDPQNRVLMHGSKPYTRSCNEGKWQGCNAPGSIDP